MRMRLSQLLISFAITAGLLIGFEIITATILPALGWNEYRLTLIFLQFITMVLAYVLVWRKRKQSSFKEIIKNSDVIKS